VVRRISCRVISSAPFGKTPVREPNNYEHEIGVADVTAESGAIINPKGNTDILSILDFPIGQILDCYA
jgi:hypothetical protein